MKKIKNVALAIAFSLLIMAVVSAFVLGMILYPMVGFIVVLVAMTALIALNIYDILKASVKK